jgi:hypothetical protein
LIDRDIIGRAGDFRMVRDFGPLNTLDWTSLDEGTHQIELTVQDRDRHEVATAVSVYRFTSRAFAHPGADRTSHPLVFLFSSTSCDGTRARVRFESADGVARYTPYNRACRAPA